MKREPPTARFLTQGPCTLPKGRSSKQEDAASNEGRWALGHSPLRASGSEWMEVPTGMETQETCHPKRDENGLESDGTVETAELKLLDGRK